jgi:hypothetical protein
VPVWEDDAVLVCELEGVPVGEEDAVPV